MLITVIENLKGYEYKEVLGVSKTEIDEALAKYEVFRVLETSGVSMNTDEIMSASEKLQVLGDEG